MHRLPAVLLPMLVLSGLQDPAKGDRFQLENGLVVVTRPVKGASQVAVVILFSVGSDHDPKGRSGLAHLLEHVFVTAAAGTEKARTVEELMKRYPGGHNAQTGERYTVVASVVPAGDLERELADGAARMGNLKIEESDLERECPRLLDEVENMFGRIPLLGARNLASESMRPTPDGGRRGGLPDHARAVTIDELRVHWRRYYKPRNAILSVAGGFDPEALRASVTRLFAPFPAGDEPQAAERPAGKAGATERKTVTPTQSGMAPAVGAAYAAPKPGSDLYAPFLVAVSRLWAAAPRLGLPQHQFPVMFAPMDNPEALTVALPVRKGETGEAALARLDEFVAGALKADLGATEPGLALINFGTMLGINPVPDVMAGMNPYFAAFSKGRHQQMALQPDVLRKQIQGVKDADLRRAVQEIFAPAKRAAAIIELKD